MAMQEPMMQEDVKAVEETSGVEKIPGLGKSKGEMSFPERRAKAAKVAMSKEMGRGIPKRWKGRGDYYFEQLDDGGLKITGGDSAKSLTGGKSTVIRDSSEIRRIFEAARGGDILERDVGYEAEDLIKTKARGDYTPEEYGVAIKERLEESTPEAEGVAPITDLEEAEEIGVSDLKEGTRGLRPERRYRNPTMEAVNYLMAEMARRPEIKEQLQRAIDALSVDVQSAEKVEDEGV